MNDDQRCKTCGYWREHEREWGKPEKGGSGYGRCGIIRATHTGGGFRTPLAHIATAHGGNPGLVTAAAFGCVEHRPRVAS